MEKKLDIRSFQPYFDFLMRLRTLGVVWCNSTDFICEDDHFSISYDSEDSSSILRFDLPLSKDIHCSYVFRSESLILREIYEIIEESK